MFGHESWLSILQMRKNELVGGCEQQTDMTLVTRAMKFRDGLDKIGFGRM
jgi:hypothetical protein